MAREVDGSVHHAEVMCHDEFMEGETEHYLVYLGDRKRKDIMTYDVIVEGQFISEAEKTDEEHLWIFKEVVGYRKNGQTWNVKMKWKDDSDTQESLTVIWKSDP
eukprot:3940039-Ditylum_brightwellii.AAC.1